MKQSYRVKQKAPSHSNGRPIQEGDILEGIETGKIVLVLNPARGTSLVLAAGTGNFEVGAVVDFIRLSHPKSYKLFSGSVKITQELFA